MDGGTALERASLVGARLFAGKGYAATTTRELARALGVTSGTFYHYYETKEDLLFQICSESLTHITEAARGALARPGSARERLEALIRAHVAAMLGDQDLHKTMLSELDSLSGRRRAAIKRRRDAYSTLVRDAIEAAQREGAVRGDITARVLTLLLLNMLNWTIFWFDPHGELSVQVLGDAITTTFLDGAGVCAAAAPNPDAASSPGRGEARSVDRLDAPAPKR